MEVEGVHVVGRDLVVLDHGSICRDRVPFARENGSVCFWSGEILVTVSESLYHPRGLHVDEDRTIIRAVRALEHSDHVQLEWIDSGQIEDALRRGHDRVSGTRSQELW